MMQGCGTNHFTLFILLKFSLQSINVFHININILKQMLIFEKSGNLNILSCRGYRQVKRQAYFTISIFQPMFRALLILSNIFFLSLVLLWVRT